MTRQSAFELEPTWLRSTLARLYKLRDAKTQSPLRQNKQGPGLNTSETQPCAIYGVLKLARKRQSSSRSPILTVRGIDTLLKLKIFGRPFFSGNSRGPLGALPGLSWTHREAILEPSWGTAGPSWMHLGAAAGLKAVGDGWGPPDPPKLHPLNKVRDVLASAVLSQPRRVSSQVPYVNPPKGPISAHLPSPSAG